MKLVLILGQFLLLIPLFTGAVKMKKLSKPGSLIVWLLVLWLLAEVVLYITRKMAINNLFVMHALAPIQMVMLWIFYGSMYRSRQVNIFFIVGFIVGFTETILRPLTELNSITLLYQCVLFAFMGLLVFYQIAKEEVDERYAWINAALMLFFSSSAVYYSGFIIMDNMRLLTLLAYGHSVVLIITYGLLTIGLWKL